MLTKLTPVRGRLRSLFVRLPPYAVQGTNLRRRDRRCHDLKQHDQVRLPGEYAVIIRGFILRKKITHFYGYFSCFMETSR